MQTKNRNWTKNNKNIYKDTKHMTFPICVPKLLSDNN